MLRLEVSNSLYWLEARYTRFVIFFAYCVSFSYHSPMIFLLWDVYYVCTMIMTRAPKCMKMACFTTVETDGGDGDGDDGESCY